MKTFEWKSPIILVFLFLLSIYSISLYAEGSIDLIKYPGKRLFYNAEQAQQLKVFAKTGEFINFGASHIGITQGFIKIYTPDGKLFATYDNTGATAGLAIINNNIEEANGPTGGGSLNGKGYKAGVVEVTSGNEGIWTIVLGFPSYNKQTFKNLDNSDPWDRIIDQPTIQRVILSWDITVSKAKAANNGGEMLKGRVFSQEYNSIVNENAHLTSPKFYVLSKAGYQYKIDFYDTDPWGFPLSCNNLGLTDSNGMPIYKSLKQIDFQKSNNPVSWILGKFYQYEPQAKDVGLFINNKIFFNLPDQDMPSKALVTDVLSSQSYETWLFNTPVQNGPALNDVKFIPGKPKGNACPSGFLKEGDGGVFAFNTNSTGNIILELDLNNNGIYSDAVDKTYIIGVGAGNDSIYWDGKYGNGQVVLEQKKFVFGYKVTFRTGEVHIMMADIENNPGGVSITRINGPNNPVNQFYYDHSAIGGPVSGGGTAGNPLPTSIPFAYSANFGNEKMLDYWSYVEVFKNSAVSIDITKDCMEYPDSDGDGITDNIDLDDDNDGIADYLEFCSPDSNFVCLPGGLDPSHDEDGDFILNYQDANDPAVGNNCPDLNNDGVCDVIPAIYDLDGDGVPNHLDLDSDNDGISDLTESGFNTPDINPVDGVIDSSPGIFGTNGFYIGLSTNPNSAMATSIKKPTDKDMDGVPDHDDRDSDNDGIYDLVEAGFYPGYDGDNDGGMDDGTGNVPQVGVTGLLKYIDPNFTGKAFPSPKNSDDDEFNDYIDRDSDNDGINDVAETPNPDPDNDGIIGLGIPIVDKFGVPIKDAFGNILTATSNVLDSDNDGNPNFTDLDSDNDNIYDVIENGGIDPDNDGIFGTTKVNVNNWGQPFESTDGFIKKSTSLLLDSDMDGVPNYIDLDSDGDMIADILECPGFPCTDHDGDGVPDMLDLDSDNDGIFDIAEYGFNTDDANDDGVFDGNKSIPKLIGINGLPAKIDPKNTGKSLPTLPDNDKDGVPNIFDLDSDNDGTHDVIENHGSDPDKNGKLGTSPLTVDLQGVVLHDTNNMTYKSSAVLYDKDKDGVANYFDLDSDNDGITDVTESLYPDFDGDGMIDVGPNTPVNIYGQVVDSSGIVICGTLYVDSDLDGVLDGYDNDSDNDGIYDVVEGGYAAYDSNHDGMIDDGQGNPPKVGENGYADVIDPEIIGGFIPYPPDFDHDAIPDYVDLDSDNDGVKDVLEFFYADPDNDGYVGTSPLTVNECGVPQKDANGKTIVYTFLPKDSDGDGIPNFNDYDSDGDGINDVDEAGYPDPDHDGRVGTGYLIIESNGVAFQDSLGTEIKLNNLPWDHDKDGVFDFMDLDSDGDGIADRDECPTGIPCADKDSDGVTDIYDLDSDNDGIADLAENCLGQFDGNMDGVLDDGSGNIGIVDMSGIPQYIYPYLINGTLAKPKDSDGDGYPNNLDLDSDNDGINDTGENGIPDLDNDGIAGSGIPTVNENGIPIIDGNGNPLNGPYKAIDTDGDGKPNMIDLDSDGDGIHDTDEGGIADPDHDGIAGQGNPMVNMNGQPVKDGNGNTISGTSNPPDFDGDGNPDFTDKDSDNDGIDDGAECPGGAPCPDTDGDGIIDGHDLDSDGDGLPDHVECPEGTPCPDGDMDGKPDWIDFTCNGNWIPNIDNLSKYIQICTGEDLSLNPINSIPVLGKITYIWTGPNNFIVKDSVAAAGPFNLTLPNIDEKLEGNYSLSLLTEKGCTAGPEDVYINVGTVPPTPTLMAENNPICQGEPMVLQTTPVSGNDISYTWYAKNIDGSFIKIDSTLWPSLVIDKNKVTNQNQYFVKVNSDGCGSSYSNILMTMVQNAGIKLNDETFVFNHNPGLKQFNILANDSIIGTPNIYFTEIPKDLNIVNSNNGILTIQFDENANGVYTLEYAACSIFCPEHCDTATLSILVKPIDEVPLDSICDIANVFTPNGDGNNDSFEIPCLELYKTNKLQIFNRWGDAVYEKDNYKNDWKGTYRNNALPAGTYYYLLTVPEIKKVFTGFITLVR